MNRKFFLHPNRQFRTGTLLGLALLFLVLVSCRQVVPPPPAITKVPEPQESVSVPSPPPEKEPPSEEAQIVIDIPSPVPLLPPMEGEIKAPPLEKVKIVIKKAERKLYLYQQGELLKTYPVDLGEDPKGPKICQGDNKTPEGGYCIIQKKDRGETKYSQALLLNYPNETDKIRYELAVKHGWLPRELGTGGLIEIHGEGVPGVDWTKGCIALLNRHMEELFSQVSVGTPVLIEP